MREFQFNENNVCMDSNETEVLNERFFRASVRTAFKDGKWYYGYDWLNTLNGYEGAGCGPSIHPNANTFDNEDEAIRYVVKHIIIPSLKHFLTTANKDDAALCQGYIDKCEAFIADTYQLSLF